VVEVYTTEPGVQLYTANYFDGSLTGKRGVVYHQHAAFAFPRLCKQTQIPAGDLAPGSNLQANNGPQIYGNDLI
jgi:aldose 1-epimerase